MDHAHGPPRARIRVSRDADAPHGDQSPRTSPRAARGLSASSERADSRHVRAVGRRTGMTGCCSWRAVPLFAPGGSMHLMGLSEASRLPNSAFEGVVADGFGPIARPRSGVFRDSCPDTSWLVTLTKEN